MSAILPNLMAEAFAPAALRLEYLGAWQALGLFLLLAVPSVLLAWRPLASIGPARRWLAVGARVLVLAVLVLVLAGLRVERQNEAVEVVVVRATGTGARLAMPAGATPEARVTQYLQETIEARGERRPDDRLGMVSFDGDAYVDLIPTDRMGVVLGQTSAVARRKPGSDPAAAINLALGTFKPDAMRRLVLVWDGNATTGDLEAAVAAARAQDVPIDVIPLEYRIDEEVAVERFVAPAWRREGEPFTLEVILNNAGRNPARGVLRVEQEGRPIDLDPATPGVQGARPLTLAPGRNRELVTVDPEEGVDVRRFRAIFEPETVDGRPVGDTLSANNVASAFTFVRGISRVLYVDNAVDGGRSGALLREALAEEGINLDPLRPDVATFPTSLVDLQGYDAVILANVPRGSGGLTEPQQRMLAQYVHDTGGGLLMIGGPDAFGAGGWQGSDLERVLPVDMDVPQRRQIPKGALVLLMHSTEMPNGNYWAEQCAIKAVEVLNRNDDVGIVSYSWTQGHSMWDYPLSPKGDGSRVFGAIRNMRLGDMLDFSDSLDLSLHGNAEAPGLVQNDARQKHIIIISDGDPAPPSQGILDTLLREQISVSTVQVAGHGMPLMPVMTQLAELTGGRAYGPVERDVSQLPQIFIKEATIVKRSLIQEATDGFRVAQTLDAAGSQLMTGVPPIPPVFGFVLTSKKDHPLVEVPLVIGDENDPLFAFWQAGLGRSAVWTSDAQDRWSAGFAQDPAFAKFFAQTVRALSRAPQSADFEVRTVVEGGRGRVIVEAVGEDARFRSNMAVGGTVLGPGEGGTAGGGEAQSVTLVQTRPGVYEATFDARRVGPYVVALAAQDPQGTTSALRGGTNVNAGADLTDLRSDRAAVERVAEATGGRVLPGFTVRPSADLFDRAGLTPTVSPLPVWDRLLPILLALILLDVAVRRIAVEPAAVRDWIARRITGVTQTVRTDRRDATLGDLRQVRKTVQAQTSRPPVAVASRKFEADADAPAGDVTGDTTDLLGGATGKAGPVSPRTPAPPPSDTPKSSPGGLASLREAKRRARERMDNEDKP